MGLLIYSNIPIAMGLEAFYERCASAGVDSVLIPDVPIREGRPFSAASRAVGVDSVYIAPPSASEETLAQVAEAARGYVYAVSRVGVTGVENEAQTQGLNNAVPTLRQHNSTPVLRLWPAPMGPLLARRLCA